MKLSYRPLLALISILLLLYLVLQARLQISFERFLDSSSIAFADFPPAYGSALVEAQKSGSQPSYDFPHPPPKDNTTIPNIIHLIWYRNLYSSHLDVSTIPTSGSNAPAECAERNPSFTVYTWNATAGRALIEEHYSWFLHTYDTYPHPIQRVDALKYFLLFHYGGIYMDMDITCRRALDPILPFAAWLPKATPLGVNNDVMAARRGHPMLAMMIRRLQPRNKNLVFPYLTIFWSTGPQFTSDLLKEYWPATRGNGFLAYPENTVKTLPLDFYSEKYTFFGHSPGGTWHGGDVAVILWLVDRPWIFAVAPAVVMTGFVLWLRRRRRTIGRKR